MENDLKFELNADKENLPLTFKGMADKTFGTEEHIKNRRAKFTGLGSKYSRCHHFYKPISRFL